MFLLNERSIIPRRSFLAPVIVFPSYLGLGFTGNKRPIHIVFSIAEMEKLFSLFLYMNLISLSGKQILKGGKNDLYNL